MLANGERVEVTASEASVTLTLPAGEADDPDRVIVLTLARK